MSSEAEAVRLVHRIVGTKHVFTSPDVPELHVSHADYETARASVQPAIEMVARMKDRVAAREAARARMRDVA
jgi:hypothetical protein